MVHAVDPCQQDVTTYMAHVKGGSNSTKQGRRGCHKLLKDMGINWLLVLVGEDSCSSTMGKTYSGMM